MPLISLVLCTPIIKFPIYILTVSLLLLLKFVSFHSFVFEFPYRLSSLRILVILYFNILVFIIPVPVSSFAFLSSVSWFSVSIRRLCLFLAVSISAWGSARWRYLRDGTRNPSIGPPSPPFLLFPFAVTFPWCQPSLTFHSTLKFPKF